MWLCWNISLLSGSILPQCASAGFLVGTENTYQYKVWPVHTSYPFSWSWWEIKTIKSIIKYIQISLFYADYPGVSCLCRERDTRENKWYLSFTLCQMLLHEMHLQMGTLRSGQETCPKWQPISDDSSVRLLGLVSLFPTTGLLED